MKLFYKTAGDALKGSFCMHKNLHHLCICNKVQLKEMENCLLVKEAYCLFPNSFPLMSGSTSVAPRYLATTTAFVICRKKWEMVFQVFSQIEYANV
jgi:hypothetical protein